MVPLCAIAVGLIALAIDGGATTLMLAEAVPPVRPFAEVTLPVVLFWSPAEAPVTFIENVHELLCASVVLDRLMTFAPSAAVIAPPPQVPGEPFGVEITRPAGKVSLKAIPVSAVMVLLF
jgi:hypothetical protein